MKLRNTIVFIIVMCSIFSLNGCKGRKQNSSLQSLIDQSNSEANISSEDIDWSGQVTYTDNIITWGVPNIYQISERALSEFNQKLITMGYDFNLQFVPLDINQYHSSIIEYENKYGCLDIAFTGFNSQEEKEINLGWILSDYYMPLDDALSSSLGQELWNLYDSKLWDSVKVEETIYIVPNGVAEDKGIFFAFNKDLINNNELKNFTGNLQQLDMLIEKQSLKDDMIPIIIELSIMDIADLIACDYRYGLIFPHGEKVAYNPYKYEPFRELLFLLNQYYRAGYIYEDFSHISNEQKSYEYVDNIEEYLSNGDFFVYIGRRGDISYDNIIIYEMPSYIRTRLNGTGIVAKSKKQEEAFLLLTLAYTNIELSNLLVYGTEGFDYMLKDGIVYMLEGDMKNPWINQLSLGIYEKTYPILGEEFKTDKLTDKKNYYKKHVIASPYLGFNFYQEEYVKLMNEVERVVMDSLDVWKCDNPENAIIHVNTLLEEVGINDLLEAISLQLDKE